MLGRPDLTVENGPTENFNYLIKHAYTVHSITTKMSLSSYQVLNMITRTSFDWIRTYWQFRSVCFCVPRSIPGYVPTIM